MSIEYATGDATNPHLYHRTPNEPKLILHCCNDEGAWGAGFVMALSKVDPEPQKQYQIWALDKNFYSRKDGGYEVLESNFFSSVEHVVRPFVLGQIQVVPFMNRQNDNYVVNMIGQRSIGFHQFKIQLNDAPITQTIPPVRYDCIAEGLYRTAEVASKMNASVHCPRFGCGLAGGEWNRIERLIQGILIPYNIPVFVYDLPG